MILSHDDQVIIAQCTPNGSGAIALLRISGTHAISVASKISKLASGKSLLSLPTHTVHFGFIIDAQGNHIDQVMFTIMQGPKTFTGQDVVEITCHNNPFIIQEIIDQALAHGARLAQAGEFTKRAVLNDKIDLIQAEAINELIHANTQMALKKSLAQLEGSFSSWIFAIEKTLIKALAFSEASFEFIDEEMTFSNQIKQMISSTLQTITVIKKTFDQQLHIRQGVRIAIIGSVNAGKSSLFNALLHKERAIVTNIAGTTRDVIEAGVYKDNSYWTLIDTAGLRQTNDIIEKEGIKRSGQEAQLADIILLVFDGSRTISGDEQIVYKELLEKYQHKTIIIQNKADLPAHYNELIAQLSGVIALSSNDAIAVAKVEEKISSTITALLEKNESPFLLNKRHYNLLIDLEKRLLEIDSMLLHESPAYELLSYHLNDALAFLCELTGKTISEQGMDAVFREFCVGK
ncbi:MAG: tRNA uridine-5-carboxymethylaminomethyl(34) synthesis GTPase MnmE [Candidatus Dependentiae bacterium]|nr:tRNA uridine-5-carboxymethylaminomethyl(34) synthesis GTPase MnmE [Candidatus Dependentiae bacterium]